MALKYGLYEPDGKHYSGELDRYHDRAVLLAEGKVGFYAESDQDRIILGSAIDVQKRGKRQDLLIFFMESPIESFHVNIIRDFYRDAVAALQDAGYEVLNIWGDETFVSSLDTLDLGHSNQSVPVLSYLSGKIIAQKPSYAFTNDFKRAVSLVSEALELMQPVLFLGYRCAVGRDAIDRENPPDLSVLPMKPYNQHAANLDSGQIDDPNVADFQKLGEIIGNAKVRSVIEQHRQKIRSKEALLVEVELISEKNLTPPQKYKWHSRLDTLGIRRHSRNSIEDAVMGVIEENNTAYLKRYLSSDFNQRDFNKYIYTLPAQQFLAFFTKAQSTLLNVDTAVGKKISNDLSQHVAQLQTIAQRLKEEHDPVTIPRQPAKDPLMDQRSEKRVSPQRGFDLKRILLIGGIIGLIIAIALAVLMFVPGIFGGGGPTDGGVPGVTSSTVGPEEPMTIRSDDGKVILIYSNDSVSGNVTGPVNIVHTADVPSIGNPGWISYDGLYYTINPDIRFEPAAELIFAVDDRDPAQIYVGHKIGSTLEWTRVDPSIEGQNLTLSINTSGMYALFLENTSAAAAGGA